MDNEKVRVVDEQHIWYNGNQFVSLKRLNEVRTDFLSEMDILEDEVEKLREENQALKVLLKSKGEF